MKTILIGSVFLFGIVNSFVLRRNDDNEDGGRVINVINSGSGGDDAGDGGNIGDEIPDVCGREYGGNDCDDGPTDEGPTDAGPTDEGPTDEGPTTDGPSGDEPNDGRNCGDDGPIDCGDDGPDVCGDDGPTDCGDDGPDVDEPNEGGYCEPSSTPVPCCRDRGQLQGVKVEVLKA